MLKAKCPPPKLVAIDFCLCGSLGSTVFLSSGLMQPPLIQTCLSRKSLVLASTPSYYAVRPPIRPSLRFPCLHEISDEMDLECMNGAASVRIGAGFFHALQCSLMQSLFSRKRRCVQWHWLMQPLFPLTVRSFEIACVSFCIPLGCGKATLNCQRLVA